MALAVEEGDSEIVFEFSDSAADRGLGLMEFTGGLREVPEPIGRLERDESSERWKEAIELSHPLSVCLVPKLAHLA